MNQKWVEKLSKESKGGHPGGHKSCPERCREQNQDMRKNQKLHGTLSDEESVCEESEDFCCLGRQDDR